MGIAAQELDDELFVVYWGGNANPVRRVEKWLEKSDQHASIWIPSKELLPNDSSQFKCYKCRRL